MLVRINLNSTLVYATDSADQTVLYLVYDTDYRVSELANFAATCREILIDFHGFEKFTL